MNAVHDIKPIETVFDGHRFRSRLEARWAVVFKELGFKYEYEPEGYELGGGVRYLPDFWLPELNIHAEIKAPKPLLLADWRKLVLFAADCDKPLLLIIGAPLHHEMFLLDRTTFGAWSEYEDETEETIDACLRERLDGWSEVEIGAVPRQSSYRLVYRTAPPVVECYRGIAYSRGAEARFEHGRRG